MKKILMLLLALSLLGASKAQSGAQPAYSPACKAQFDAINRGYDEQITSYSDNPKINSIDRDYRTLMLNFYRAQKLSAAEAACTAGAGKQFRNCLDQANALNQSYNSQVAAMRSNTHYPKQERALRVEQINQERNKKLRELQESCSAR